MVWIFFHQLWWFIGFSLPWKFEPNLSWLSFWLIFGGFHPPPFFAKKSDFGSCGLKFFVTNFAHLLVLVYPENLSQIRVGWVFCWFGGFTPPPPYLLKNDFCLGGAKNFVTNFYHLLVLACPENLSQIRVGWVFGWFFLGFTPLFCPKIGFWLRGGGKIFLPPTLTLGWS